MKKLSISLSMALVVGLLITINCFAGSSHFDFGVDTYEKLDNMLIVNSLGDNTTESQFKYQGIDLGYNDYIPENAFKNNLYNEGYTKVYDADNTSLDLTPIGYMGRLGNPRAYDTDYVLTSEYAKYSSQYQDVRIENNKGNITNNSNRITNNKNKIEKNTTRSKKNKQLINTEKQQRKQADNILNQKIKTEKTQRKQADTKEKIARIKGDKKLNNKIKTNKGNIKANKNKITNVNKKHTAWSNNQDLNIRTNTNNITNNSRKIESLDSRVSELEETQMIVGLEGRIFDSKKWQVGVFADYSTNRNKVDRTGIRFTYKFGKSFEEKKIEELERKLNKLIEEK